MHLAISFGLGAYGADGLRRDAKDAVLNSNYIRASLKDLMSGHFGDRPCMQEVLFRRDMAEAFLSHNARFRQGDDRRKLSPDDDIFPPFAHGAMLIEPTESESKASLDLFIAALRDLALAANRGDSRRFADAPHHAPRRRLDETRAARNLVLRWTKPEGGVSV